jgi:hypothetical protein
LNTQEIKGRGRSWCFELSTPQPWFLKLALFLSSAVREKDSIKVDSLNRMYLDCYPVTEKPAESIFKVLEFSQYSDHKFTAN